MKRKTTRSGDDRAVRPAAMPPVSRKIIGNSVAESQRSVGSSEQQAAQGMFVAQRAAPEEEELMQGKFPVQRTAPEEEELMQGKFPVQRAAPEEEELMQGKFTVQRAAPEEEELMQGKMENPAQREPDSPNGIPHEVQAKMETAMGADFSDVTVHPNSSKAPEVGALAYTQGNDVHFAPGQFSPDTSSGRQLLGHELAHVVQQRQGRVQPTTEVEGMPVNDNPDLEKEADDLGRKGV